MTDAEIKNESTGIIDLNSKFWRTTLFIVSVLLIFAGPTYVPYAMSDIVHIDYLVSIVVGAALLVVGLILLLFLIRKKIIV